MRNRGRDFIACSLRKCRWGAWGNRTKLPKWRSSSLPTIQASSPASSSLPTGAWLRFSNALNGSVLMETISKIQTYSRRTGGFLTQKVFDFGDELLSELAGQLYPKAILAV